MVIFTSLHQIFIIDNFIKSFRHSPKKTLEIALAPLTILIPVIASAYLGLETYKNQFVLFHILHSWASNVQQYRLQIANMTKKFPFSPIGPENLIACLPLIAHVSMCCEIERVVYEPIVTYVSLVLMFCLFYGHIYLLSQQWLAYQKGTRKWWTIDPPKEQKKVE